MLFPLFVPVSFTEYVPVFLSAVDNANALCNVHGLTLLVSNPVLVIKALGSILTSTSSDIPSLLMRVLPQLLTKSL